MSGLNDSGGVQPGRGGPGPIRGGPNPLTNSGPRPGQPIGINPNNPNNQRGRGPTFNPGTPPGGRGFQGPASPHNQGPLGSLHGQSPPLGQGLPGSPPANGRGGRGVVPRTFSVPNNPGHQSPPHGLTSSNGARPMSAGPGQYPPMGNPQFQSNNPGVRGGPSRGPGPQFQSNNPGPGGRGGGPARAPGFQGPPQYQSQNPGPGVRGVGGPATRGPQLQGIRGVQGQQRGLRGSNGPIPQQRIPQIPTADLEPLAYDEFNGLNSPRFDNVQAYGQYNTNQSAGASVAPPPAFYTESNHSAYSEEESEAAYQTNQQDWNSTQTQGNLEYPTGNQYSETPYYQDGQQIYGNYGLDLGQGHVAPSDYAYYTNPLVYSDDTLRSSNDMVTCPPEGFTIQIDELDEASQQDQNDYNEYEDSTNCTYNPDTGDLKAATYPQLIAKLCSNNNTIDIEDFLLTYRSFSKPEQLLSSLFRRYYTAPPESARNTHLRVFNILSKWIENFWFDFSTDPTCTSRSREFLAKIQNGDDKGDATVAKSVAGKLERKVQGLEKERLIASMTCPQPIIDKDPRLLTLLDCDSLEVARQLTILTWDVWQAIQPWECLGLAWTKKGGIAEHIEEMTKNFNYFSGWVTTTILVTPNIRARVKFIRKFLDIACHLRALGNFNGVMEIWSGLNRQPVFRMVKTFTEVQKEARYQKIFQELAQLTSHERSYANLREAIRVTNPPVIPYLGMYLSDMVFMEEGNPTKIILGEKTLYNFFKCRSTATAIKKIQQYQQQGYALTKVDSIQVKLKRQVIIETEPDMYDISSFHEPREGKEPGPKPAALTNWEQRVAAKLQEIRATPNPQSPPAPKQDGPKKRVSTYALKDRIDLSKRKSKDKLSREETSLLDRLCDACWEGDRANFIKCIQDPAIGPILNLPGSKGSTALYCACRQGHAEIVIDMINTGWVDVNIQAVDHGGTAMHAAAFNARGECLAILITANADRTIKNKKGLTAAQDAKQAVMDLFLPTFDFMGTYPSLTNLKR